MQYWEEKRRKGARRAFSLWRKGEKEEKVETQPNRRLVEQNLEPTPIAGEPAIVDEEQQ